MNIGVSNYVAIGVYMLIVVAIGLYFSKNEKTSEDYLLGGRNMPWWAVGISFVMSLLSTYSIVMIPGEIFNHGLSMWVLGLLGPFMMIVSFLIFIRFYFKLKSFTPFEYLERRYDKRVRVLIGVIYLWTRVLYLAMVLFATSKVFEGGFGWPAWVTILTVGVIGIIYTICGGLKAVIWTDVMQFLVLVVGLAAAVIVLCQNVDGGFFGAISYTIDHGHGASLFSKASFYKFNPYIRLCFWILLMNTITAPLFYCSADQISVQRLLSTKSYKDAKKSILLNPFLSIPFTLVLWFIGMAIFAYYSQNPSPLVKSGDTAFFTFIATKLPAPFPGLILAAMLAAAMSTLDSGMNSLSTVWVKEFHIPFINPKASEKHQVRLSRLATFYIGAFAITVAIMIAEFSGTLRQSVVEAATIFDAFSVIILPAYLLAVFTRASVKIIWNMAFLCWGINFGGIAWYMASRPVDGSRGPMSLLLPLLPLAVALVLWIICSLLKKHHLLEKILHFAAMAATGFGAMLGFWYVMSNYGGGGELSFAWVGLPGLLVFLLGGFAWAILSREKADSEKCRGLTIWSVNKELAKEEI